MILVWLVCLWMTRPGRIRPPITLFCLPEAQTLLCKALPENKYTRIQIYKYTNTQTHKHTNTKISLSSVYRRLKHFCASFALQSFAFQNSCKISNCPTFVLQRPKHFSAKLYQKYTNAQIYRFTNIQI